MAFTPPMDPARFKPSDLAGNVPLNASFGLSQNPNRRSFGPPEKFGLGATNGINEDANTWWLDVLSPTDEEMKMLSKVLSTQALMFMMY